MTTYNISLTVHNTVMLHAHLTTRKLIQIIAMPVLIFLSDTCVQFKLGIFLLIPLLKL